MKGWLLPLLIAVLGAGQAAGAPAPIPADYFTRQVMPLNVTPSVDPDNSYSDLIGPDGGQLTTLDAAGNTYTLTVPKGALGFPEQLTMTPLTALKGMPFKGGVNAGVQLEPEGTFFVKPVTLEVAFVEKPDLNTLTPFNYTGAGQDFTTTMLAHDPGHFVFLLNHFSGAGFAISNEAERTAEVIRQPLADEERIQHYVREQVGHEHQKAVLGQETNGLDLSVLTTAMNEYEKQVIGPLKEASSKSCTVSTLYLQKVLGLERQRQLLGVSSTSSLAALGDALGGAIAVRCLEEEAQVCFKSGDLVRLAMWGLGMERQAQLLSTELGPAFVAKFAQAYAGCSRFEVQLNSTLTQKSSVDPSAVSGGFIQGKGTDDYRATITSILPIRAGGTGTGSLLSFLAGGIVPSGDQPLPYAGYTYTSHANTSVAVAQTNQGTYGVKGDCTESGIGTTPGRLAVQFLPAFKPGDPNAPDPALEGLTPAQKRDVMRILHDTPRVGLLAPPRTLDLPSSWLSIGVGQPTEHIQSSCAAAGGRNTSALTTWLDAWSMQLKTLGESSQVGLSGSADVEPGWKLSKWQPGTGFPLKIEQNVPHHEEAAGVTYDETWHLDITVVHTPKE